MVKKEASALLCYVSSVVMKSESMVKSHLVCFRGKLVHCLEVTLRDENLLEAQLEALEERGEEVASTLLPPGSSGSPKLKLAPLRVPGSDV